ncbi:MAG: PKD domain-containing protein, partial [Gemmatimonadetes bacterium]|nr:PKD domain-containing protein [Gemmatimonadota bacterium]
MFLRLPPSWNERMRRHCLVALAALCAACADRTDPTGLDLDPLLSRPASSVRLPGTYSSKVVRSRTAAGEATSAALPAWGARTEWDLLVLFDGEAVRDMVHAGPGARSDLVLATDGIQTKVAVQVGVDGAGDILLELVYRELGGGYRTVAGTPLPAMSFVAGEWYVLDAGLNGSTAWLDVTHFHSGARIGSVREARSGSDGASLPTAALVVSAGPGRDAGLVQATHAATVRVQTVVLGDGSRGPFPTGSAAALGLDPNESGVDHYWPYAEGSGATVADVVGGAPLTYGGAFGADWYWIGGRNPSWDFNNGFPAGSTPVGNVIVENGVLKLHREGADARATVRLNEDGRVLGLWWDEVHVIVGTDTDDPDQYLNPAHPYSGFAAALRTDVGVNQPPQRDLIAWSITHEKGYGPRFQVQTEQSSSGIVLAGATPLTDPVANGPFHVRIMGLGSTVQVDFLRLRSSSSPLDLDWQAGGTTTGWTQAQLEGPRLGMRLSHKNPGPTVYGPGRYSYYDDLNARYVGLWSTTVLPPAPNVPPVAVFSSACTDLDCTFTDGSTDPDGSVVAWAWDLGDGTTSTAPSPTHTYALAGTYTVTLTVTDDQGATGLVTQTVGPTAANVLPTAAFTAACTDLDCT